MKVFVSFYPSQKGVFAFYHSEKEVREAVRVINATSEKEEKLQVGNVEMTKAEYKQLWRGKE